MRAFAIFAALVLCNASLLFARPIFPSTVVMGAAGLTKLKNHLISSDGANPTKETVSGILSKRAMGKEDCVDIALLNHWRDAYEFGMSPTKDLDYALDKEDRLRVLLNEWFKEFPCGATYDQKIRYHAVLNELKTPVLRGQTMQSISEWFKYKAIPKFMLGQANKVNADEKWISEEVVPRAKMQGRILETFAQAVAKENLEPSPKQVQDITQLRLQLNYIQRNIGFLDSWDPVPVINN